MSRLRELIDELCPDGIEYRTIKEVCDAVLVPMRDKPKVFDGSIPWCRIEDIEGRFLNTSLSGRFVSEKTVEAMRLRVFPTGTVVCSCSASLGAYAITTQPIVMNQTFIGLVPGKDIEALYLLYYMTTCTDQLRNRATTGTIAYVSRISFETLLIPVPPIEVQREVVRILDSFQELDDALTAEIEARERQQQNAIDSLIGLEDNSAGEGMVPLGTLCQSVFDGDHQPPPQSQNGIPFIVIANFNNGVIDFTDTKFVSEDYYEAIKPARKPERGDIILSVTGSYGISALVDTDRPFCFQRHVAILKPRCDSQFLLALMRSGYAQRYFDMNVTGAVQKQISLTTLRKMPVPYFDENRQADIAKRSFEMGRLVELLRSERDARRKQFEHYRDKLLSFPEKEA